MARFVFYFLVIWSAFCGPSLSADFQFPEDTDVTFKYFVAGLPFGGNSKSLRVISILILGTQLNLLSQLNLI